MGWSIGYDSTWARDIGYGVPATCDHPGCTAKVDRGLGYVCGGEPYGGEHGCGLFICAEHTHAKRHHHQLCQHCADRRRRKLQPSPDRPEWMRHKLTDESWQQWRDENPDEVAAMQKHLVKITIVELAHSEQDYLEFDLFVGEDADIKCRTVKLVKTRKQHACFFGQNGDGHSIAPGRYARHEKALVDGDYWGSYYVCIPCLNREMADLRSDLD